MLLVSAESLDAVARQLDPSALPALGRGLGAVAGRAAARALGGPDGVTAASIEEVTHALAFELSLRGLGLLAIERWGRALVLALDWPALDDDDLNAFVLEGALSVATGRQTPCLSLGRDGSVVRALVANPRTIARARGMLTAGLTWGDVLARLHAGGEA